jgi:hypothetical protein
MSHSTESNAFYLQDFKQNIRKEEREFKKAIERMTKVIAENGEKKIRLPLYRKNIKFATLSVVYSKGTAFNILISNNYLILEVRKQGRK